MLLSDRGDGLIMNLRQFAIAPLFALVLLTVASTPLSGQYDIGSYDPWLDFNEDGIIDVNELHSLGEAYGSSGDPTRNITIASHVTKYLRPDGLNVSIPPTTRWFSEAFPIDGYAKVTLLIWLSSVDYFYCYIYACDNYGGSWIIEAVVPHPNGWVKTYDVMSQRIRIEIENSRAYAITAMIGVYVMA